MDDWRGNNTILLFSDVTIQWVVWLQFWNNFHSQTGESGLSFILSQTRLMIKESGKRVSKSHFISHFEFDQGRAPSQQCLCKQVDIWWRETRGPLLVMSRSGVQEHPEEALLPADQSLPGLSEGRYLHFSSHLHKKVFKTKPQLPSLLLKWCHYTFNKVLYFSPPDPRAHL